MSLQITRLAGKKNQNMPLKMLCATNLTWATIMQIVTIVHVNWPTWSTRGLRTNEVVVVSGDRRTRKSGEDGC